MDSHNSRSLSISTVMNYPASYAPPPNLSALNPLRSASGPKTAATKGARVAPTIPLSTMPDVSKSVFAEYLASIESSFPAWNAAHRRREERPGSPSALGDGFSSQIDNTDLSLPPLESVPSFFFDPNFDLADPTYFDMVAPPDFEAHNPALLDENTTDSTTSSFSSAEPGQDSLTSTLSTYMDTVELHLASEISRRSSSFFSALANLNSLNTHASSALEQVSLIRNQLHQLDSNYVSKALDLLRISSQRQHLIQLVAAVDRAKDISKAISQAQELSLAGEWIDALRLTQELVLFWNADPSKGSVPIPDTNGYTPSPTNANANAKSLTSLPAIGEEEEEEKEGGEKEQEKEKGQEPDILLPFKLSEIGAFKLVPQKINSIRKSIAQNLRLQLLTLLSHEFQARLHSSSSLSSSSSTSSSTSTITTSSLENIRKQANLLLCERVRVLLIGLVQCGPDAVREPIEAWRDSTIASMRAVVRESLRKGLPASSSAAASGDIVSGSGSIVGEEDSPQAANSSSSPSSANSPSPLAKSLRELSHSRFLLICQEYFNQCLAALMIVHGHADALSSLLAEAVQTQSQSSSVSLMMDSTTSTSGGDYGDENKSETDKDKVQHPNPHNQTWDQLLTFWQSDLVEATSAVSDVTFTRFSKIFHVRSEQHSKLSLQEFYEIFSATSSFVSRGEQAIGTADRKSAVASEMRATLVHQAKEFLTRFHIDSVTKSAKLVEEEQWAQAAVSSRVQHIVDLIVEASISNPKEFILKNVAEEKEDEKEKRGATPEEKTEKTLSIEQHSFTTVSACLRCIELVSEYIRVVVNITMLSQDAMPRIIEFLKQFNSRTCQVVLGAGAMRSAGLKNITAKHLALSSQTLSVIIALVPYIRETLRRHLPPAHVVMLVEFDKLKRDYQEHQNEIHAKLVAIMSERLQVHCKSLQSVDWQQAGSGNKVNPYMETLVKETTTLFKVLSKYLPPTAFEFVLGEVYGQVDTKLREEYSAIEMKTELVKERILVDVKYLSDKLGELGGNPMNPGPEIEKMVREKEVIREEEEKNEKEKEEEEVKTEEVTAEEEKIKKEEEKKEDDESIEAPKGTESKESPEITQELTQTTEITQIQDANRNDAPSPPSLPPSISTNAPSATTDTNSPSPDSSQVKSRLASLFKH